MAAEVTKAVADRTAEVDRHPAAKDLTPREREMLAEVLANHPGLSIETALANLREAGM